MIFSNSLASRSASVRNHASLHVTICMEVGDRSSSCDVVGAVIQWAALHFFLVTTGPFMHMY